MGSSPSILDAVVIPFVKGSKILDIGCGFGRWGVLLTTNYWETRFSEALIQPEITGVDGFYCEVIHTIFPPLPFNDDSFNTVLLLDVVEHLDYEKGKRLIDEAKRISLERLILSTPNWAAFRKAHGTMTGWNDLEAHLSYWPRKLLRDLGFRVYGAGWRSGGRYFRGILGRMNLLSFYDEAVRRSLESTSRYFPLFAENVVGVWDKRGSD
jgi:SAM-dependent methyltransferase